ncbi:MAG TPA: M56 family metallopeptidase, partial [Terriglobia bacterium]|nr:M56 family metallopeptidase [Terriglobia bacterium]
MLAETLFWFHPMVWVIRFRMIEEQERACDEEVLRRGGDPQVYAESILKICELYLTSPLICVSGITGSDLKKRIREIMGNRVAQNLSWTRAVSLAIVAVSVLALPVAMGIVHATAGQDQPQVNSQSALEISAVAARNALNQGVRSFRQGNYDEAIAHFKEATQLDPHLTNAELYLATAYGRHYISGDTTSANSTYAELAIQSFSNLLQNDPRNASAVAGLGSIYQKRNQLQKAREQYLRNIELEPQKAEPQDALGQVDLAIVGDVSTMLTAEEKSAMIEEGLRHLRAGIALKPDYGEAMETLSLLLRQKAAIVTTEAEKKTLEEEASSWLAKSPASRIGNTEKK